MATSAALSRSNITSQGFWNFFNLINDRSKVVDPADASGKRKFVYSHPPDFGRGFKNYPVVVVEPLSPEFSGIKTGNGKNKQTSGQIIIEVRSSDSYFNRSTVSDPHGKGLTFLDAISDDIIETLEDVGNLDTLRGNNIGNVSIPSVSNDWISIDGELVYTRTFTVEFNTGLLAVSA